MRKIKFELSAKLSKSEKAAQGKSGFVPELARWVIERSNAWMERCKNLVKNFEHLTTVAIPFKKSIDTSSRFHFMKD
jgi:hypothetical protein